MFCAEIQRLHNQGFTANYIASHLSLAPEHVYAVLSGGEAKPVYVETAEPPSPKPSKEARRKAALKVKAEAKRAEALRLLAEAHAEMS